LGSESREIAREAAADGVTVDLGFRSEKDREGGEAADGKKDRKGEVLAI
jgi:hypothetical protein